MSHGFRFAAVIAIAVFGSSLQAADAPKAPAAAGDETLVDSPFFKLGWPKVEMPKFDWKPGFGGDGAKNAADPAGNPVSRALDKVADTSRKASDSVKSAWGSAMDRLTSFGKPAEGQVAKDEQPGFLSRMFAQEEPKQSQTVQEFLAQERVGTTK